MSAVMMHPVHDQGVVWRDGQLVPFADATTHVLSHMAARGSQIFDVMLVTRTDAGPCGVGLRAHVTRFLRSAELMGMEEIGEVGQLEQAVAQTVIANASAVSPNGKGTGPFVVKLIAAWTDEAVGIVPLTLKPTVYVLALPFVGDRAVDEICPSVKVSSVDIPKMPASILPPSMKVAAGYTSGVRGLLSARAKGFDQIAFRDENGDLAESTTSSLLAVINGRLVAPPLDSVLDGITRRIVLDVAQSHGIPYDIRTVGWDEVMSADELLMSSTNSPVVPVVQLDEQEFSGPGPVTLQLAKTVGQIFLGHHPLSASWLTPLQGLT